MNNPTGLPGKNSENLQKQSKLFVFRPESRDRLRRKVGLARIAIFWEQLWAGLYLPFLIGALFVALSWIGFFQLLSDWVRIPILAIMVTGFVLSFFSLSRLRIPSYQAGLNRVEKVSGYSHRPLTALEDDLAVNNDDPDSNILWNTHKLRMLNALESVRTGYPHPFAFKRDPFGLRIVVILLLIIGFTVSDGKREDRLMEAIAGSGEIAPAIGRIDAWVTPPAYTGRVPVFLTGDLGPARSSESPISIPEGSILVVRSQGLGREYAVFKSDADNKTEELKVGGNQEGSSDESSAQLPVEHKIEIVENSRFEVRDGVSNLHTWNFQVIPDANPAISFEEEPEVQLSGSIKLTYRATDDYGVASAEARIEPTEELEIFESKVKPRPLVRSPDFSLTLPRRDSKTPVAESYRNLTSHPWAGSKVTLTLSAKDERGQEGFSKPHAMTLPIREFHDLFARAIVEQRRILAMDVNLQTEVIDAMDAIMLAPHKLLDSSRYYPGMRFVYERLVRAKTDDELLEVIDLMWELALTIEDGDLSFAERALRDAQEALRRALEEDASDEEITRLTQELREALRRYMQAMMQQMRNNPQVFNPMNQNTQGIRSQDLDQMLNQIEELAKTGARDAAQQLLSQMQQMLENMQTSQSQMMQSNGMMNQMMNTLNQLGQMIQRQQELMDETFQLGQQNSQNPNQQVQRDSSGNPLPGQSQNPMSPEQLADALRALQEQQDALGQQLENLMQQMQENGMQGNEALGEAGQAMEGAEQSIGQGNTGNAVNQQGEALDALRRGAQQLSEQMQQGGSRSGGQMMGRRPNEDPLGRPRRNQGPDFGDHVKVPEQIDVQRARQILEELRKRFSDPDRPNLELDYIERLLNPY